MLKAFESMSQLPFIIYLTIFQLIQMGYEELKYRAILVTGLVVSPQWPHSFT